MIAAVPYIELPQKPAPKDRYLTRAEIDKLLTVDCEAHIRLAILLMLTTAGRVGAILDLTWTRVDLERGQINLRVDLEGPRRRADQCHAARRSGIRPCRGTVRICRGVGGRTGALDPHGP